MAADFNDIDKAFDEIEDDPVGCCDVANTVIRRRDRGTREMLRQVLALLVGAAREIEDDFSRFEELREADCLQDNVRLQSATEDNFNDLVSFGVVYRAFHNTQSKNRIHKYDYVVQHFTSMDIEVSDIADAIKAMKGIDKIYELAKSENPRQKQRTSPKSNTHGRRDQRVTEVEESDEEDHDDDEEQQDDEQEDQEDDAEDGTVPPGGAQSKASAKPLTVKYILDNYLLVNMPTKQLDRYRNGQFSEDERRGLEMAYDGKGPKGLREWTFVSELELEDPDALEEDDDNDGEDAA